MSDYFLPELIIVQILLKLPVKALIRFTTVCKSWRSIITSPFFISSHLYKPRNQALILRRYDEHGNFERYSLLEVSENRPFTINSSSELEFPFELPTESFSIVGSCRGVVCFSDYFDPRQPILLCNFSVKKRVVLPMATINLTRYQYLALGFGYADHDFKVVRLVYDKVRAESYRPKAEVFSLRTGRWRRLIVDVRLQNGESARSQVFLNGVVYWLRFNSGGDRRSISILLFRVVREVFDEIKLPDELGMGYVLDLYLTSVGESLAVIKYKRYLGWPCDVWLMEDCGVKTSWTRLYSFSFVGGMEKVLALRKNGEALVASQGIGLVAFDLEKLETKNLVIQVITHSFHVEHYAESLELL